MIYTVKLDENNYLLDKSTGKIVDKYDPKNKNLQLVLSLDNIDLTVDANSIVQEYGGNISVEYLGNKYIIDDGYQNTLVKCGYIVYKNYDVKRCEYTEGVSTRNMIIDNIRTALLKLTDYAEISIVGNDTTVSIVNGNYSYKIIFSTVNSIVNRNYRRKDNNLTYYPFDKSMDKYGTIHVSIFAQKLSDSDNNDQYSYPMDMISDLIKLLGWSYHYISMPIKGRLVYWEGL